MIPGETRLKAEPIEINVGRRTAQVDVTNTGDRPIQVGSHYPFFEVNRALRFERVSAFGMRLDIAAGTAVRFEPGEEKTVTLVEISGEKRVFGLNDLTRGSETLDETVQTRLSGWEAL